LGALGSLHDVELDILALLEGLESVPLESGVMDEHIVPSIEPNKSETLAIIEPFYRSLSLHTVLLSLTHNDIGRVSSSAESHGMMTIKGEIAARARRLLRGVQTIFNPTHLDLLKSAERCTMG
jgi:hypothetical protein